MLNVFLKIFVMFQLLLKAETRYFAQRNIIADRSVHFMHVCFHSASFYLFQVKLHIESEEGVEGAFVIQTMYEVK
jgi:hypothetical protein